MLCGVVGDALVLVALEMGVLGAEERVLGAMVNAGCPKPCLNDASISRQKAGQCNGGFRHKS